MPEDKKESNKQIQEAIETEDIDKLYFNGFAISIGQGDVLIALHLNGKPIKILNTSFTVAKTLVKKLNGVIEILEEKTEHEIMTTEDIITSLSKEESKKKKSKKVKV